MASNTDRARSYAVKAVTRAAFFNRRGHGGGPHTRRVLTREQLTSELHKAISRYEDGLRHFQRVTLEEEAYALDSLRDDVYSASVF